MKNNHPWNSHQGQVWLQTLESLHILLIPKDAQQLQILIAQVEAGNVHFYCSSSY